MGRGQGRDQGRLPAFAHWRHNTLWLFVIQSMKVGETYVLSRNSGK